MIFSVNQFLFCFFFFVIIVKVLSNDNKQYIKVKIQTKIPRENTAIPDDKNYFDYIYSTSPVYTTLQVGSNKQEIPFKISLNSFSTYIVDQKLFQDMQGVFNKDSSKTYKSGKEITYFGENFYKASEATDDICFHSLNSKNKENRICISNFKFAYATEMQYFIKYAPAEIGLQLFQPRYTQTQNFGFIKQLKENDIIKNYLTTFYFKNFDEGFMYIGANPEDIDKSYLNASETSIKAKGDETNFIEWTFKLKTITAGEDFSDYASTARLSLESDFLTSTDKFSSWINANFFYKFTPEKKCEAVKISFTSGAYMMKCQKGDYLKDHPKIKFEVSKINEEIFTIEFGYDELFKEKDGYMYYQVILFNYNPEQTTSYEWTFGKIFFMKYMTTLDTDGKLIKFYEKRNIEEHESGISFYFKNIIIIICLICIACVIMIIAKKVLFSKSNSKKIRANELEENVLYEGKESINSNNNEQNI